MYKIIGLWYTEALMNFYEYLGVKNNATEVDIRKAFRSLAKIKHPDHNKKENAFWDMVELNIVRDTLLNPIKRREYDRSLLNGTAPQHPSGKTPEPVPQTKKNAFYRSVKSLFTYHCRTCGVEMSSTWRGYCLLHYLEYSGQIDNPDFIFEYGGYKYKWADPPSELREKHETKDKTTHNGKVHPLFIVVYTLFIIVVTAYIIIMGKQFLP